MSTRASARAREVFDAALELAGEARSGFIERECADDQDLRMDVLSLLAALDRRGDALDAGAAAAMGMGPIEEGFWEGGGGRGAGERGPEIVGVHIGGYRLARLIGAGGMGTVYEAEQENPRRTVALKIMHATGGGGGSDSHRRFVEEAQILARLRHPGVAQVFGAGTHTLAGGTPAEAALAMVLGVRRSVPWIAMEFVEGARWITTYAEELSLGTRGRLALLAEACDAVHHGHMKGVIHRDLKPANLLVDAGGVVKVIDFGVARAADSESRRTLAASVTGTGALLGTVRYMSPEQCDGDPHALDTRSDVYSLGVVLYELLTGAMPYDLGDHSFTTAVRAIREAQPTSPSSVRRALRGDVERIVLKALEKERERRYQSAAEFADDIRRHLADMPIRARPTGVAHRAAKFARRNPLLVGMGVLATIAIVGGAAGVSFALVRAVRAEGAEKVRRAEAERRAYVADLYAAGAAINAQDGGGAIARLDAAPEARRGWEWRYLRGLADQSIACYLAPEGEARYCASPDGRMVVGHSASGTLSGFDADMGRARWSAGPMAYGGEPRFSPDGKVVVVTGAGLAVVADAADGRRIHEFPFPSQVIALGSAISPDGRLIAIGCGGGHGLRVYDAGSGEEVFGVRNEGWVYSPDFSPDGRFLASSEFPGTVIREVGTWTEVHRIRTARAVFAEPSIVRYSPDGRILAVTIGLDIEIHNAADGTLLQTLRGHTQRVQAVGFDAAGRRLVSGSVDKTVRIWDLGGTTEPVVLLGHGAAVDAVAFVPDPAGTGEQRVWSSAAEPGIRLWRASPPSMAAGFSFISNAIHVHRLVFDQQSRVLVAARGSEVIEWDATAAVVLGPERSHLLGYAEVYPDSHLIVGTPEGQGLARCDLETFDRKWSVAAPVSHEAMTRMSPDGRFVVAGLVGAGVRVVRAADGSIVNDIGRDRERVLCAEFIPDSTRLLTGSVDGSCRIWEIATAQEVMCFRVPQHFIHCVGVAPDGRLVAAGGDDERVHLWDPSTGKEVRTLSGFRSTVWSTAFSPDGSRLAVGSQDRVARLFDVATGDELLQLRRHTGTVMSLAWSPDGRFLATGGYDQRVYVWDSAATAQGSRSR